MGERLRDPRALAGVVVVVIVALGLTLWVVAAGNDSEQDRAETALAEGLEAHARGDVAAAEEAYLRVIELDPQNKFAYYNLGVIEQQRGALERAEANYRTAIGIDPMYVPALFNLAILQTDADEPDEAVALYEAIIGAQPEYAAAHLNLGFLLIEQGEEERGRQELEEAVRLDPNLEARIGPTLSEGESVSASPSP